MRSIRFYKETYSPCPVCLKTLKARIVKKGDEHFLEKTCPEHGSYSTVVWRGKPAFGAWGNYEPPVESEPPCCPDNCGLCSRHLQKTCCVLLEVTARCDLGCPYCFAMSEDTEPVGEKSPEEFYEIFKKLVAAGRTFVHLSGGEPTVRDDLPLIVKAAADAGCEYIQLNSNGLRIAREPEYLKALKDAGLSFVFMQFDGLDDEVYKTLRGRPLLKDKLKAIENCRNIDLGVTLVPTVTPGVNDHQLGDLVRFAIDNSPIVRGIHFQPVSYFGRYPAPPENSSRITLPEVITLLEEQTGGMVRQEHILPSKCDHPRCGFHSDFIVRDGKLIPTELRAGASGGDEALRNRKYIGLRWKYTGSGEEGSFASFLSDRLTLTAMAFQDAYNLDYERLRRCSLHVYEDGKMIPFCAHYLTGV